jgi:hypothetical protein
MQAPKVSNGNISPSFAMQQQEAGSDVTESTLHLQLYAVAHKLSVNGFDGRVRLLVVCL